MLRQGLRNKMIARTLGISEGHGEKSHQRDLQGAEGYQPHAGGAAALGYGMSVATSPQ